MKSINTNFPDRILYPVSVIESKSRTCWQASFLMLYYYYCIMEEDESIRNPVSMVSLIDLYVANSGLSSNAMANIAEQYGYSAETELQHLTFEYICKMLLKGPFIYNGIRVIKNTGSRFVEKEGHSVVITGYEKSGNRIHYIDPYPPKKQGRAIIRNRKNWYIFQMELEALFIIYYGSKNSKKREPYWIY